MFAALSFFTTVFLALWLLSLLSVVSKGVFLVMFFIIWSMLLTPSRCFLYQTFVLGCSITARSKGPLSRSSCGRRFRYCLNNSTGHLGSPEANIFGNTSTFCVQPSLPCLRWMFFECDVLRATVIYTKGEVFNFH